MTPRSSQRRDDILFGAALLIGLLTLWRTAFIESHWDEDSGVAIGWLLSKGWKLYSDVFSHHMPLDYIPSWAISCLFGPSPQLCRAFMVALWAAVCCSLWRLGRASREGANAAALFTLLSSQWVTFWMGQMLLVENIWGYIVVLLLVLIEAETSALLAAASGTLLAVLLCSSLTCAPAFALLLAAFLRRPGWRKFWRLLAGGFSAWLVLFGLWSWRHADLSLWFEDAVRFNAWSYAYFSGLTPGAPTSGLFLQALGRNLYYFASILHWDNLEQYFEGILRLAFLGYIAWQAFQRRWLDAVWWALLILALRLRPEHFRYTPPFHSAPFFLAAAWLLSREVVLVWDTLAKRSKRWACGWAAACAFFLAATIVPTSWATLSLSVYDRPSEGSLWVLNAVKQGTDPNDAITVLPSYPKLYVDSARVPATPSVFYLPWQAAWPEQHARTMEALESHAPKLVIVLETTIWGIPWQQFAGDIDAWIRVYYRPVMAPARIDKIAGAQLWVRSDYAEEFQRRVPDATIE